MEENHEKINSWSFKKGGLLLCILLWSAAMYAVTFSDEAKRNCQCMDSEAGSVTLIFAVDQAHFAIPKDSILSVWVSGSINNLQDTATGYQLDQWSEDSCFYRTFSCAELEKPGNSGQPEFCFYVLKSDSTDKNIYGYDLKQEQMDKRLLCYNGIPYIMILMPCGASYFTTDLDELGRRCEEAKEIRPLADFDLSNPVDQHHIANFRQVPGTVNLYRSYHPYYPSNSKYDTEQQRLYWVAELGRQAGIRSDISLTGNLEGREGEWYVCGGDSFEIVIPDYQRALIDSGNICYVGQMLGRNPSVVDCYYRSNEVFLAQYIKEVVEFIADSSHPMPVQIHCAIGADRTGMICAVIAALCGADWLSVVADYEETGNMKVQTYRHANRLRYALTRMTGVDPDRCTSAQLAAAIRSHLVDTMGVLTHDQIDQMIIRLQDPNPASLEVPEWNVHDGRCYDVLGRSVDRDTQGLKVSNGTKIMMVR